MKKKQPATVDVLKRMRTLLRKGWSQKVYARNAAKRPVKETSPDAVSFCLYGAGYRAVSELKCDDWAANTEVVRLLLSCLPAHGGGIVSFNDQPGRKKKEVIEVVNCAIKKAEATAVGSKPKRGTGGN